VRFVNIQKCGRKILFEICGNKHFARGAQDFLGCAIDQAYDKADVSRADTAKGKGVHVIARGWGRGNVPAREAGARESGEIVAAKNFGAVGALDRGDLAVLKAFAGL
jgi:hypothetical protein